MRRIRTVRAEGSKYITPEGEKRLRDELVYLWKVKRPQVTQAVADAAALGDRSENAEYIYGKKQLREIDSRIRYLKQSLEGIIVVDTMPDDRERVFFGAWVRIEDEEGGEFEYRIVGPHEFDADKGYISMDSPLARALLRKRTGEEVAVQRPSGAVSFTIVEVSYRPFS